MHQLWYRNPLYQFWCRVHLNRLNCTNPLSPQHFSVVLRTDCTHRLHMRMQRCVQKTAVAPAGPSCTAARQTVQRITHVAPATGCRRQPRPSRIARPGPGAAAAIRNRLRRVPAEVFAIHLEVLFAAAGRPPHANDLHPVVQHRDRVSRAPARRSTPKHHAPPKILDRHRLPVHLSASAKLQARSRSTRRHRYSRT